MKVHKRPTTIEEFERLIDDLLEESERVGHAESRDDFYLALLDTRKLLDDNHDALKEQQMTFDDLVKLLAPKESGIA